MAESGGTRLGTMIAEIDLDSRRYDAGLRAALQSAETTTQSAGQAWRRLGTGSTESIDRMRANVVRSYETIRNSATSTAADIERAEAAARARLEQINRRYFGSLNNQMRQAEAQAQRATSVFSQMFASFTLANIAAQAVYKLGDAISKVYRDAFNSVENLKVSSASLAATITTFADKSSGKSIADIYKQAYDYSVILTQKLEEWDARTIATGENLRAMVETMAQAGVLLDVNNKKQEEGIIALANALAITTQGQNAQIQFRQEIRGLMDGEVKATNRLATMIDNVLGGSLESSINKWREQGTLIENIGSLLVGFNAATKDLESTWAAVGSTLETIYHKTLRGLFIPVYEDIINLGKQITLNVLEQDEKTQSFSDTLNTGVYKVWESIKSVMSIVGDTLEAFKVPLGLVASLVGTILDGWGNIVAVLDIVLGRVTTLVSSLWSFSSGVANFGKMFYSYVSGGVEAGDAVLQQVKSNFAEAGSKAGKAFSGGLLNEISDNVEKYNKNVNAVVEKAKVTPPKMATIVNHEEAEKAAKKATTESERAAKRAANEAEAEAKRHAQEMLKIREQAETDYNKSMFAEIDNQKAKIEAEYQQREKAGYDSVKNERLRQRLIQDLETDRIKEFEKGFEAERDAYEKRVKEMKELEEQRVEEALKAMEEMQQAYEDFVYDVKSATSDIFMDLFEGGFSSMFDNIETMFRRTLANMAAEAIAEPIIVPIIQSVAGGVGSTISNAMGIPSIAGQSGGGFNLLGNANTLYSAVSGGMESGVYNALTNGMLNNVGASIFGAGAWGGTAVSTGALAAGGELGWGAANMAALGTGTGAAGIAGTLAVAAPYLAAAAIAIPLVMKMLEDEPEPFLRVQTTSTSNELSNPNYKWADGEGKSLAGFDYNLTMQDIGGETQKELGAALKNMLDAQFTAIEDTLNVSVNEAIVEAQNAGTGYGDGFFSRIDLRDYEDNIAGALQALTDDLFLDIRDNLTNQLTDGKSSIFNADFFKGIAVEGESAVDTFLRFGKTLEINTSFMEDFTKRTEELGQTASQAYNAIVAIEQLGAAITGLSSASVASALWESIKAGQSASDFVATLENQVREGVAQATVNAFAQSLYSAFLQPINAAVGQMVTSMVSGGITTGAALTASMATIRESLNLALEILKNEDFQTLIETFTKELTEAFPSSTDSQVYVPAIYTPPVVVKDTAAEKAAEKTTADTEAERAAAEALQKAQQLKEMMQTFRDSIADSGLSEFWKEAAQLNREMLASIKAASDLGATEAELAEIRTEGTLKAVEALKKWNDEVNDYISSLSNNSDLLKETISAYNSAVAHYLKYIDAAKEAGTETKLLAASIREALLPVTKEFKELFYSVLSISQTDIERQVVDITRTAQELVEAIEYLSDNGAFDIEDTGLQKFKDDIYDIGEILVNAQLQNIKKTSLESLGESQAQTMDKSNEYSLIRMADRYSLSDLTSKESQQQFLDNFSTMSYDQILEWSNSTGNSFDTIFQDITTLNSILNEVSEEFENLRDSLKDYRDELITSDDNFISPDLKTKTARNSFLSLSEQALSTDKDKAKEAMGLLPEAAKNLLDLSKKSNTDIYSYNKDFGLVLSNIKKAEDYAGTYVNEETELTDTETNDQISYLKNISSEIQSIDTSINEIFSSPEMKDFFNTYKDIFGSDISKTLDLDATGIITALDDLTNAINDNIKPNLDTLIAALTDQGFDIDVALKIMGDPAFDASEITLSGFSEYLTTAISKLPEFTTPQTVSATITSLTLALFGTPTFNAAGITLTGLAAFLEEEIKLIPDGDTLTISKMITDVTLGLFGTPTFNAAGITLTGLAAFLEEETKLVPEGDTLTISKMITDVTLALFGTPGFDASGITLEGLAAFLEEETKLVPEGDTLTISKMITDVTLGLFGTPTFNAAGITLTGLAAFLEKQIKLVPEGTGSGKLNISKMASDILIGFFGTPGFDASYINAQDFTSDIDAVINLQNVSIKDALKVTVELTSTPSFQLEGGMESFLDSLGFIEKQVSASLNNPEFDSLVEKYKKFGLDLSSPSTQNSLLQNIIPEIDSDRLQQLFKNLSKIYRLPTEEIKQDFKNFGQILQEQKTIWSYGNDITTNITLNTDALQIGNVQSELDALEAVVKTFALSPVTMSVAAALSKNGDLTWDDAHEKLLLGGTESEIRAALLVQLQSSSEAGYLNWSGDFDLDKALANVGLTDAQRSATYWALLGNGTTTISGQQTLNWKTLEADLTAANFVDRQKVATLEAIYKNSTLAENFATWDEFFAAMKLDKTTITGETLSTTLTLTSVYIGSTLQEAGVAFTDFVKAMQVPQQIKPITNSVTATLTTSYTESGLKEAGITFDTYNASLAGYITSKTINDKVEASLKAYYDISSLINSKMDYATFRAQMKDATQQTITDSVTKTLTANFIGDKTTVEEATKFMDAWGVAANIKDVVTANLEANINANLDVVSNKLLTETTFANFAATFLRFSNGWETGQPEMQTWNYKNDAGVIESKNGYSIIDGLFWIGSLIIDTNTILTDIAAGRTGSISFYDTMQPIKGYATGGYHEGGLRFVGERGLELEATGASRIYSHDDTMNMLYDTLNLNDTDNNDIVLPDITVNNNNDELIEELRMLRAELAKQKEELKKTKEYNYDQAVVLTKMYNIMDDQDRNGTPPERV